MLSVVVPAHNEAGYLEDAVTTLHGALARRESPFELVIVENGSTDRTAAIATRLA